MDRGSWRQLARQMPGTGSSGLATHWDAPPVRGWRHCGKGPAWGGGRPDEFSEETLDRHRPEWRDVDEWERLECDS